MYIGWDQYHWQHILIFCILFNFVAEYSLWSTELISTTLYLVCSLKKMSVYHGDFRELESGKHCGLGMCFGVLPVGKTP